MAGGKTILSLRCHPTQTILGFFDSLYKTLKIQYLIWAINEMSAEPMEGCLETQVDVVQFLFLVSILIFFFLLVLSAFFI